MEEKDRIINQILLLRFIAEGNKTHDDIRNFRPDEEIWNQRIAQALEMELMQTGFIKWDSNMIFVTEKGKEFLRIENEKLSREKDEKELTFKKLKLDTANAERIFDTYWYTFGFAVAAFAISLVLLILKIIELAGSTQSNP